MYMITVTNNGNVNNNHIYILTYIHISIYYCGLEVYHMDYHRLGSDTASLATITAAHISGFDVKCQYTVHKHNNMYICIIYV